MPTREVLASFWRDWDQLSPKQQREFRDAVAQFIANLAEDKQGFHPRLRVKRVQGHPGIWEMTWAYDGRATSKSLYSNRSCRTAIPALPTAIRKARLLLIGGARSRETIQASVRSSFTSHMSTDARVPGVSEGSIALNT